MLSCQCIVRSSVNGSLLTAGQREVELTTETRNRSKAAALNQWRQCGGGARGCQLDMWVHQLAE